MRVGVQLSVKRTLFGSYLFTDYCYLFECCAEFYKLQRYVGV